MDSTAGERATILATLHARYAAVRRQWSSLSDVQAPAHHAATWRERRSQIDKDVARTDRDTPLFAAADSPYLERLQQVLLSYVMYNQELGYSQVCTHIP